ncbi:dienelactone hydrolase family protein [Chitiniphilus purpureus]|uniref:Dienelactone hydrolase family protein n=1 Tax=Chitiniphilus purpureus TaxID=2981137 RepID=A0ABY6DNV5_9NEIS|nr:dienelactone hydrolase family protein [Chitiniphilus sp. CD1]UXY16064.1 dienelactone hydrolase family protein [Chitiniphilus sp. CD1]
MTQTTTLLAQAVGAAAPTQIHTDATGLAAGEVRVDAPAGAYTAYHAAPLGAGPHPVVLLVHEIFGVHEHIRDVARRLAKLGYLAIAPELFERQGKVQQLPSIDDIRAVVARVPDEQVLADLDAALAWATQHGGDVDRVAVTGFCWGGRITWLYAAHQPRLKAAVAWYGRLAGDTTPNQPRFPIDIAGRLLAPVLGLYGGADAGIPLDTVAEVQHALAKAGSASTIHVYPDAPHAFHADYRPSYRAEPAADGWARLQRWFKQHGV